MPPAADSSLARPGPSARGRPAARAEPAGGTGVPLPITLFLFTVVLVPIELGFFVGSLFFTWSKAFIFLIAIPTLIRAAGELKPTVFDGLLIAHVLWTMACTLVNRPGMPGVEWAGTYFLEIVVVYLLVRLHLRTLEQIHATVRMLVVLAGICALVAIPESLLGQRFIHDWARALTGFEYTFSDEERLGLLRATSFFEHPILHGLFCAYMLSMMWFSEPRPAARVIKALVLGVGTFFSLSSAPLLTYMGQAGLIALERATRWLKGRLMIITLSVLGLVTFLNLATGRGAFGFLAGMTLNPATAWYRNAIWESGLANLKRSPIIGIDPARWTRFEWMVSSSLDNHWLLMALRGGVPGVLMFFGALWMIWRTATRGVSPDRPALYNQLRLGWGLMIVALILGGATVAFFGRMQPLLAFLVAIGAALAANRQTLAAAPGPAAPAPAPAPGRRTIL